MKKSVLILAAILALMLCTGGCSIPGSKIPDHFTFYPLNHPREIEGNIVTLTSATAADSYHAPDGTVYTQEPDGTLILVTADVEMLDGWEISAKTYMQHGYSGNKICSLFCDPIIEVSDDGKVTNTLLFSLKAGEFSGFFNDYSMTLYMESENRETYRWFTMDDYPSIYPLNYPWKLCDDSIALTEVITADSYHAPDGIEYRAEKVGTLVILKFKADLTQWRISKETELSQAYMDKVYPVCDPFVETEGNGGAYHVLIFSLGKTDDYRDPETYIMHLCMESDWDSRTQRFYIRND